MLRSHASSEKRGFLKCFSNTGQRLFPMNQQKSIHKSLLSRDDCLLLLVDIQQSFLDKLPSREGIDLVGRISWLLDAALQLEIPVVAMAEDIPHQGSAVPEIVSRLPAGSKVHNKMIFGLAADELIMSEIRASGRNTAVLVGLETDVCVAHSALGLLENGFQVVAATDGTASPAQGHEIGLERMRGAGVVMGTVKSIYYEWVRGVAGDDEVRRQILDGRPLPPEVLL